MAAPSIKLEAALQYAALGFRVHPVHIPTKSGCSCRKRKQCPSPGKHPVPLDWQNESTTDPEKLRNWWKEKDWNVGILLGEKNGLVDAELDHGTEEDGLKELAQWFGGTLPEVPKYRGNRGPHLCFGWCSGLPDKDKVVLGNWEFRVGNSSAQSVLPPSNHESGAVYTWVVPFTNPLQALPCLPTALIDALNHAGRPSDQEGVKSTPETHQRILAAEQGTAEGVGTGRNSAAATWLGSRFTMIDVSNNEHCRRIREDFVTWNLLRNKPPLDETELTKTWKSILKKAKDDQIENGMLADYSAFEGPADGSPVISADGKEIGVPETNGSPQGADPGKEVNPNGTNPWRMRIIRAVPRKYRVWSPYWNAVAPNGLELTADQLHDWRKIRIAVLEQFDVHTPRSPKGWDDDPKTGAKGMVGRLIDSAQFQEAVPDIIRPMVVAEYLLDLFQSSKMLREDEKHPGWYTAATTEQASQPCLELPEGGYILRPRKALAEAKFDGERITRDELVHVVRLYGAEEWFPYLNGKQVRVKHFSPEVVQKMHNDLLKARQPS